MSYMNQVDKLSFVYKIESYQPNFWNSWFESIVAVPPLSRSWTTPFDGNKSRISIFGPYCINSKKWNHLFQRNTNIRNPPYLLFSRSPTPLIWKVTCNDVMKRCRNRTTKCMNSRSVLVGHITSASQSKMSTNPLASCRTDSSYGSWLMLYHLQYSLCYSYSGCEWLYKAAIERVWTFDRMVAHFAHEQAPRLIEDVVWVHTLVQIEVARLANFRIWLVAHAFFIVLVLCSLLLRCYCLRSSKLTQVV